MKKYICLVLWAAILGGISSLWLLVQSNADDPDTEPGNQIFLPFVTTNGSVTNADGIAAKNIQIAQGSSGGGRIDAFTFYIPYPTDILDDQFEVGLSDTPTNNRPPPLFDVDIETIISIAVHREGSIIYYDHWEDGLEPNLTLPVQPSTEVWGDNIPANGIPPGFSTDLLATAATPQDDVIILRNVVILPRDQQVLFYDGGDVLTSVGGAIAVSLTFWTAPPGPGILYTDAWELYPTNRWGTDYRIPIGENLAGTGANQRPGFEVVGLNVQAVTDNTIVNVDLDADGNFETNVTLNQGEQFTRLGTEVGLGPDSVLVGARVQASEPVQVHLFVANPASRFEARGFTVVPENQWTDDYLAPRSSDGDFWLYNPNESDLEITVETSIAAPTTIIIPAKSTVKYPPVGLSTATGVRFTSTDGRPFYGVVTLDEADAQDWGHALLPFNRLATQTLVGLGLGNNNNPPDGDQSRIYVTAAEATTIFVDYDNDGSVDANFSVAPLAEVAITDPDHNMTGAFLFTTDGTPFISVWGQDENADPALPSIDAGTGIVPLPSLLLQKTFAVAEDVDCSGSITVGDTLQFKLQYFNETANIIRNVFVADALPGAVTYLPNTTLLNGALIPDNGTTPFPLDEGGYNVGEAESFGTGSITFNVRIDDSTTPIINRAEVSSEDLPLGTDSVIVFTSTEAGTPLYQIGNTVVDPPDGVATSGQVVTFSLAITNTGSETISIFPLQDIYEAQYLTFQNAVSPPDVTAPGQLNWNDLTNNFGDLAPGAVANLTVTFAVNNLPGTVAETVVRAVGAGGTLANGATLPTCSGLAALSLIPPPTPTP
ncbi:MAG: IgGFc-binding protein, partial [Chloroflexi bacterium]|nr:IgGFc-binding protein [Chloroflexota bacterium]